MDNFKKKIQQLAFSSEEANRMNAELMCDSLSVFIYKGVNPETYNDYYNGNGIDGNFNLKPNPGDGEGNGFGFGYCASDEEGYNQGIFF